MNGFLWMVSETQQLQALGTLMGFYEKGAVQVTIFILLYYQF